ncbi:MAG: hypothetical protein IJM84_05705 [Bacteroidaceae bacterium]|nr:hypothetical protein [Bacteroidaceae bacterium]
MFNYLYDIVNLNFGEEVENNWSVWDYDKIAIGDRYYMVKLGVGATGIIGTGFIDSSPMRLKIGAEKDEECSMRTSCQK